MPSSVYLDFAATAALRPPEVIEAVSTFLREVGATPGRSGHRRAVDAGRVALRCRRAVAALFGIAGDPGRVVFQQNATHALNTALHGTLKRGDRLVRTGYDHNAVRRPAAALAANGIEVAVISARADGAIDLAEAEALIRGGGRPARVVAVPHVSNVLGQCLPVRPLSELARSVGALLLVDAAQSAGHIPVDVESDGVDLLAFTGHKGLLGPQGIGGLWVREGVRVEPLLRGGTGGDSMPEAMPEAYPDHLEAGTLNAPGIAGLLAGIQWLQREGVGRVAAREVALKTQLHAGLSRLPAVTVHSPLDLHGVGIVTFTSSRYSADEMAARLDRDHGIQSRAGLHCAPEPHAAIGTERSGAVRFSLGWASTDEDVVRAVEAVALLHDVETHA